MKNDQDLIFVNYKVTDDSKEIDEIYGITPKISDLLQSMYEKVERKNKHAISELNNYIGQYPWIPQFKNLLIVLYYNLGYHEKSHELNHQLIEEFPDYLFGRINLVYEYLNQKEYDKIPDILGDNLEIKLLYPERNEFHISEVATFYQIVIRYFTEINDIENAEGRLKSLKEINEKFGNMYDEQITGLELLIFNARFWSANERLKKLSEKARKVKVIPVKVVEPTTEKPKFRNELIEELYRNNMRMDRNLIFQILSLPRETLIPDLHDVIYDSIARFDYFKNDSERNSLTHEFIFHAMFMLTELKSEESLNVILDILRQEIVYLEYWLGDYLTEDLWEIFFNLGLNQIDKLKNFLFEPNHYVYTRMLMSDAVSQIALHYPDRRDEIIEWYKDVINEFISRKDDGTIIDSDLNGFMIGDILDIDARELLPNIKHLFDFELVSEVICGNFEDVEREFISPKFIRNNIKKNFDDIYSRYDDILETWHYYQEEKSKSSTIKKYSGSYLNENEVEEVDYDEDESTNINKFAKIGRNDHCPCGSGKKFKKCCLKN